MVFAGDKSGRELAFAERRLAESRGRMKSYRDLENSFIPGSVERKRASILVEEIEVLQEMMDRLCQQARRMLPSVISRRIFSVGWPSKNARIDSGTRQTRRSLSAAIGSREARLPNSITASRW
jgi:hypothetical protein